MCSSVETEETGHAHRVLLGVVDIGPQLSAMAVKPAFKSPPVESRAVMMRMFLLQNNYRAR